MPEPRSCPHVADQARAGEVLGFETLSVDQALAEAMVDGEPLHCGDGHLNERGNEVVARALAPELRRILAALPGE